MTFKSTAPRNKLEQTLDHTSQEAGQPAQEQDRISYGLITAVNDDTSQVKIRLLDGEGELGEELAGYFPLIPSWRLFMPMQKPFQITVYFW